MNTQVSYVVISDIAFENAVADGETFDFTISMTTNLSGLIRTDSQLTVEFAYDNGSKSITIPCYVNDVLIDEYTFTNLAIPNTADDNTITSITLAFDYLDSVWRNINFTYRGTISESIRYLNVVT